MITDINSEDRLVQQTFAEHLRDALGWETVYAYNTETFGPNGTLGRASEREAVLVRDLRAALARLNPQLPEAAREQAVEKLTRVDYARSLVQHNREFYGFIRDGVPVDWRDGSGEKHDARARVIDFQNGVGPDGRPNNRFLAVRELKLQGLRVPHYNTRADLVCFVNGLPLVFIELKAVYRNIRAGFDNNLTWYLDPHVVPHAFHHNAVLVVSNGDSARYGSITSKWEHFVEWKRNDEKEQGRVDAQMLLDGMLAQERLLDLVENFILFDDGRPGGTRKIVARNHQVLGVNNAVAAVLAQEELKRRYPPGQRIRAQVRRVPARADLKRSADAPDDADACEAAMLSANDLPFPFLSPDRLRPGQDVKIYEPAHPELGRLGVFWHTQGSGKSYSMAFFAEKVRRVVPGNFTFVVMTDRDDLDDQIWRTFVGCGVVDEKTAQWGFDIIPHREVMKTGFQTPDGKRVEVEDAFKDPEHPFRIAIVCAMWLTGFDVECLSTLYIDKPMKAHTLMQAIARANRVYPGKDCGVIVDYHGMLASLREALAQYARGDDEADEGATEVVEPIEERVQALAEAIEAAEGHLQALGFDPARLVGALGFARIQAMHDAVDALCTSDEVKRRFEIMTRVVCSRFQALVMEPSVFLYAERHDNLEAISRKLYEKRDTADVTEVLKELHKIVNEAIRAQGPGEDHAEGLTMDLSQIDFAKLRDEFASKVRRKHAALQDIRDVVEQLLARMLACNPQRMDYYKRYQEIIADYNREKDRITVEETFARVTELAASLDAEQKRAAAEGLNEDELALFDLLFTDPISRADREKLRQASKSLLASLKVLLQPMPNWTKNSQTQAEVKVFILDDLWRSLPRPPFSEQDAESLAERIYEHVWQRSESGCFAEETAAA